MHHAPATAATLQGPDVERVEVIQVATPSLGNRSYLLTDGSTAVAVDPQRDLDRFATVLDERGLLLTAVLETHLHNDYISGGLQLARSCDAIYAVPAGPRVGYNALRVHDGDEVSVGGLRLIVFATPGHTDHHVAYAICAVDGPPQVVCTGGSLLYGSTGRTDLLGAQQSEALARQQHRSVRRLAAALPAEAVVLPTHGFGSLCAASSPAARDQSTIAQELAVNPVLLLDEDSFVTSALQALDPPPAYYSRMAPINAAGPEPATAGPPRAAGPAEVERRLRAGDWVIDIRPRAAFARAHLRGCVNIDARGALATYVGWLVPFGAPLTLISESMDEIAGAWRELLRIGYEDVTACAMGAMSGWAGEQQLGSYPVTDFATLTALGAEGAVVVLDVRRASEWRAGHLTGAMHIPLPDLPDAIPDLPDGQIWVYCAAGFRAAIAASLLAAAGRDVVLVDDDFASRGPSATSRT